jgi:hypothetical protein
MWPQLEAVAHTIPYDGTIMGDTMSGNPSTLKKWASVTVPTLVMVGGASSAFFQARRENHEVFSLVDERRASPLTFDILADGFLACISNGAAEIAITPKCPFLPEVLFSLFFMSLPKLIGRFLFQSSHDSQRRDARFALHQAMNMVLIHFERLKRKI